MESKDMQKQYRLFVGNPGVGKSTLVNCLTQKELFKSGLSFGEGLTKMLYEEEHDGITYMDTPGLADKKLRKAAAEAITKALKKNGTYQIFFVVTLDAGRVKAEDLATIEIVLDNAKDISNFSVILNKLSKFSCKALENPENSKKIFAEFFLGVKDRNQTPTNVLFLSKMDELDDQDNKFIRIKELEAFVEKASSIKVFSENVHDIPGDEDTYKKLLEGMENQLSDLKTNNKLMMEQLKRSEERYENLMQRQHELQVQMKQADLEEGRRNCSSDKSSTIQINAGQTITLTGFINENINLAPKSTLILKDATFLKDCSIYGDSSTTVRIEGKVKCIGDMSIFTGNLIVPS